MVEHKNNLDSIFGSLSDGTRRDILLRVAKQEHTISELATDYKMSFAAVAKHVAILEMAQLVQKHKQGKQQIVSVRPDTLEIAQTHLKKYQELWKARFAQLDELLESTK